MARARAKRGNGATLGFEATLWAAADKLRGHTDAAEYEHVVLGQRLGELIDLIGNIGFGAGDGAKDVLGRVYEYFLGQFASKEGKRGGEFYTPRSVVKLLVAKVDRYALRRDTALFKQWQLVLSSRCHEHRQWIEIVRNIMQHRC